MAPKHQDAELERLIFEAANAVSDQVVQRGLELASPLLEAIKVKVPDLVADFVSSKLGEVINGAFRFGIGLLVSTGRAKIVAPSATLIIHEGPPPD